jgi:hypothetical protein
LRFGWRHRRDDVGDGPTREPRGDVAATLEDLRRRFKCVLQGVPEVNMGPHPGQGGPGPVCGDTIRVVDIDP